MGSASSRLSEWSGKQYLVLHGVFSCTDGTKNLVSSVLGSYLLVPVSYNGAYTRGKAGKLEGSGSTVAPALSISGTQPVFSYPLVKLLWHLF